MALPWRRLVLCTFVIAVGVLTIDRGPPAAPPRAASATPSATGDEPLHEVGYFKSFFRDRVYAYHAPNGVSEATARRVLATMLNTAGRISQALIYERDAKHPGDRLTLAGSTQRAFAIKGEYSEFTYALIINPAGQRTIQYFAENDR